MRPRHAPTGPRNAEAASPDNTSARDAPTPGTSTPGMSTPGTSAASTSVPETSAPSTPVSQPDAAPVAGLLLAAGAGRRLGGRPKALLDFHGRPLVEHAARVLREGGCAPVHVVLGAAAGEVRMRADLASCVLVENPGWAGGMGSSLRAGLASLAHSGASAVVVLLVDQPGIGAEAVRRLVAAHGAGADLAAASYTGERGHPVLLGARWWAEAAESAEGDRGARAFLDARRDVLRLVECSDIALPGDIDTPGDLPLLD